LLFETLSINKKGFFFNIDKNQLVGRERLLDYEKHRKYHLSDEKPMIKSDSEIRRSTYEEENVLGKNSDVKLKSVFGKAYTNKEALILRKARQFYDNRTSVKIAGELFVIETLKKSIN
jgi:hypothetical protein